MKKMLFYLPAVLSLLFDLALGLTSGPGAVHPLAWWVTAALFLSAALLSGRKWFGCIGGLAAGCLLIAMSTQYTGQVIDIERPLGVILSIFYLACGIGVYLRTKEAANS